MFTYDRHTRIRALSNLDNLGNTGLLDSASLAQWCTKLWKSKKLKQADPQTLKYFLCAREKSGERREEKRANISLALCGLFWFVCLILSKCYWEEKQKFWEPLRNPEYPHGVWNPSGTKKEVGAGNIHIQSLQTHVSTRAVNWAWKTNFLCRAVRGSFPETYQFMLFRQSSPAQLCATLPIRVLNKYFVSKRDSLMSFKPDVSSSLFFGIGLVMGASSRDALHRCL